MMKEGDIRTFDRAVRDAGDKLNFPNTKSFITNVGGKVAAGLSIVVIGGILVVKCLDFFFPRRQGKTNIGRR